MCKDTYHCKHGKRITFETVQSEINDDFALNVIKCNKCYEHPDLRVGDYKIMYIDEVMAFAAKEE